MICVLLKSARIYRNHRCPCTKSQVCYYIEDKSMHRISAKFKVALLCGGPSLERGISLNSARSVLDNLGSEDIEIVPVYFDVKKNPYHISQAQLYSNTPSDFDFKLRQTAMSLTERSLIRLLKSTNIVFPAMHGKFGDDGGIQRFLEKHGIPFVGSGSTTCKQAFDKFRANTFIARHGFFTLPSALLKIYHTDHEQIIERFFRDHRITRAIVKPANGGSSIGVFSVSTPRDALEKARLIFSKRMGTRVVIEQFAEGKEFTIIILQNRVGLPVALPPTEIEAEYTQHQIFDFRKKYLPTRHVAYHCPPRFNDTTIEKIQAQAEQLAALFGIRDFARFDGWVLSEGNLWFCDFNLISGMEQNSFLFQQASRIGMTHRDILHFIIERACTRYGIVFPPAVLAAKNERKEINILMGGDNSERQVSLMSGTNVWLKLRGSQKYLPRPHLLDARGNVWRLPYQLCLNHTVEEITKNCEQYRAAKTRLTTYEDRARLRLGLEVQKNREEFFDPQKMTLDEFIAASQFVFIALHGGDGENGMLQKMLRRAHVKFNGSDEKASQLCMDKWITANAVRHLAIAGVRAIQGKVVTTDDLLKFSGAKAKSFWEQSKKELGAHTLIVKPRADGCSTGVAHLYSSHNLKKYLEIINERAPFIPRGTFKGQRDVIEMPSEMPQGLLFEKFIETDVLRIKANDFKHRRRTGWIEITVGVVEVSGALRALNPSITIAEGEVLTVEEKFQGGTGVNITPPPTAIVKSETLQKIKNRIERVAERIGIRGYARIDAFTHVDTGDLFIIEINTLPGLTPSTVFYHQALAENPSIFPRELLEMFIKNKGY